MNKRILLSMAVFGLLFLGFQPYAPAQAAANSALYPGCVSQWYVSVDGVSSWALLNTDPDGLPLSALRFDAGYSDPTDINHGYLDFNRDGKTDIFSAVPRGDGTYQWRYSSGGTGAWQNLAYDTTPPDQLRFGDFNGDGYTDVFSVAPIGNGNYQYRYSQNGTNSWQVLTTSSIPLSELRFGDFNGDGRTDIFFLSNFGLGNFAWNVFYFLPSGTSEIQLNSAPTPLSEMQFGDINGDGKTDVFTTTPSQSRPGLNDWKYSSAGVSSYLYLFTKDLGVHDVQLNADFNGDHNSDWFYTAPGTGVGLLQWWYIYILSNQDLGSLPLAHDSTPADQLRLGDFDGNGKTDVFKLTRTCSAYLPAISH